jgi:hypothetical protein
MALWKIQLGSPYTAVQQGGVMTYPETVKAARYGVETDDQFEPTGRTSFTDKKGRIVASYRTDSIISIKRVRDGVTTP